MSTQARPQPGESQLSPISRRAFFKGMLAAGGVGSILATFGCPSGYDDYGCYCDGPGMDYDDCYYCDYIDYGDY